MTFLRTLGTTNVLVLGCCLGLFAVTFIAGLAMHLAIFIATGACGIGIFPGLAARVYYDGKTIYILRRQVRLLRRGEDRFYNRSRKFRD